MEHCCRTCSAFFGPKTTRHERERGEAATKTERRAFGGHLLHVVHFSREDINVRYCCVVYQFIQIRCARFRVYFCSSIQVILSFKFIAILRKFENYNYSQCGYQSLFPRLYRLLITIILQDHPGSSRQTLRSFLIVDPRACGCAHNPPRCVSTPSSEKEKTCERTNVPQLASRQ